MKVQDKVFVVTGGGSGIGRALVLGLLARGARVAAVDLNPATLQETANLAGEKQANLSTHVANIAQREAVEALPARVIERHGAVDGLINNAGIIHPFVKVNDLTYDVIERVMNVNFYGTLYMIKAFLPYLLQRPEAHIANVSSMGSFVPVPGQTLYGASKAAVKLLTEGLRSELMDTPVKVSVIFPGAVGTNIASNSGVNIPSHGGQSSRAMKVLQPEEAARIILDGIEQDRARILVGSDSTFMDRLSRLSPERAAKLIYQQMKSLLGG